MKLPGFKTFFNHADRIGVSSLNHRLRRSHVVNANIANSETPGFRALGYGFEEQLQTLSDVNSPLAMRVNHGRHHVHPNVSADGKVHPDVFVEPTESISHDGNTVDLDQQMSSLAQNQILYRATVEMIQRKVGLLRYAIEGGR